MLRCSDAEVGQDRASGVDRPSTEACLSATGMSTTRPTWTACGTCGTCGWTWRGTHGPMGPAAARRRRDMTNRRMVWTRSRTHMMMTPTRRRRRRTPGVDHDCIYDHRFWLEPRAVAMCAWNSPIGVLNDAIPVAHRANRSVIIVTANPRASIRASRAKRKGRCNQNCLNFLVHNRLAFCLLTTS